jgi:hypothetical protein
MHLLPLPRNQDLKLLFLMPTAPVPPKLKSLETLNRLMRLGKMNHLHHSLEFWMKRNIGLTRSYQLFLESQFLQKHQECIRVAPHKSPEAIHLLGECIGKSFGENLCFGQDAAMSSEEILRLAQDAAMSPVARLSLAL